MPGLSPPRSGKPTVDEDGDRLLGVLTRIDSRTGFGFIHPLDADGVCGAHKRHLRGLTAGQKVEFSMYTNSKGRLRARRVVSHEGRRKVVMRRSADLELVTTQQCIGTSCAASPGRGVDAAMSASEGITEGPPVSKSTHSPVLVKLEHPVTFQRLEHAAQSTEDALRSQIAALQAQAADSSKICQGLVKLCLGLVQEHAAEGRDSIESAYHSVLQLITSRAAQEAPRAAPQLPRGGSRSQAGAGGARRELSPAPRCPPEGSPPQRTGSLGSGGSLSSARSDGAQRQRGRSGAAAREEDAVSPVMNAEAQARRALASSCGSALCTALAAALHRGATNCVDSPPVSATEAALRAELADARCAAATLQQQLQVCSNLRRIESAAARLPWREEAARAALDTQAAAVLEGMHRLAERARKPAGAPAAGRRRRVRGGVQATAQQPPEVYTAQCTAQHAFSIEPICHGIAVFAPYEWAQLSSMAPLTLCIIRQLVINWTDVRNFLVNMQVTNPVRIFVWDCAPVNACRELSKYDLKLRHEISRRGPDRELKEKLLFRVQMTHHIFDEARIRFGELLNELAPFYNSFTRFYHNLSSVLESREARRLLG
eukprot:TRINITY_DN15742_c0_g1_i1.p1 TRINITY_DN15742_c0_g1~~TRINITY_DN15742_c0_g1_i1.p1  ORF type:complete len:600 (+),score=122.68 TRINITY_DN15742_c0_g1_i1:113-1912(+)